MHLGALIRWIILIAGVFIPDVGSAAARRGFIQEITSGPYQNYSGMPLVELGGTYYHFEGAFLASWQGGQEFCRDLGLLSVSVETEEENLLLQAHMRTIPGLYDYWTSGGDLEGTGDYTWAATGEGLNYTDWAPEEPTGAGQWCVQFSVFSGFKWRDYFCELPYYLICEEIH